MSARRLPVSLHVWSLMVPLTLLGLGTGLQIGTPESSVPTAIEQALIEHACITAPAVGDAHEACLSAQLLSLRNDFGRDLSRLSGSERRTIDSVCSKIRAALGRDAYVECLSEQLVSVRNRRSRASPDPSLGATPPSPSVSAPSAGPAPPARPAPPGSSRLWIGATLVTLFVAGGGVFLAMKGRRAPRKCRVCGKDVPDSGGLCQPCRHEAAEALRRAAAQRADQQRAHEEEQHRQSEQEEEQRRQKALEEEEARLRQQEQARQAEQARRDEELRQREEEARQRRQADVPSEEAFDPYAVLGVQRDASKEDIRAAYEQAKLKYDADQVSHFGIEVQAHFKAKAQAVERAYRQLTQ